MSRTQQIYYHAVFGAIGGILAWLVVGSIETTHWNVWIHNPFIGAGTGLFIGGMVGAVEGIVIKRSTSRAIYGTIAGALAGFISGLLGLLIGGAIFVFTGGGLVGRLLGWLLLGMLLGIGEGIVSRSKLRTSYGAVGGAVAGGIGGIIYEAVTQMFLTQSGQVQIYLSALGLILIGACLGGIIPLTVIGLSRGTLRVLNGLRETMEISIVDALVLGSYDGCEVYLPGDPRIEKKHARVYRQQGRFFITPLSPTASVNVNGQVVTHNLTVELAKNALIQVGNTTMQLV